MTWPIIDYNQENKNSMYFNCPSQSNTNLGTFSHNLHNQMETKQNSYKPVRWSKYRHDVLSYLPQQQHLKYIMKRPNQWIIITHLFFKIFVLDSYYLRVSGKEHSIEGFVVRSAASKLLINFAMKVLPLHTIVSMKHQLSIQPSLQCFCFLKSF